MKKTLITLTAFSLLTLSACTDNARSRHWGGTSEIKLPPNRKLVNVTWKESDMWILHRAALPAETAERYEFQEKSNFGVMEGKIVLVEDLKSAPTLSTAPSAGTTVIKVQ